MNLELLNLIPNEILNLIFYNMKPTIKYSLNKRYFYKYYKYRFTFINNKYLFYQKFIHKKDFFFINNLNYMKFLIKNDVKLCVEFIINCKIKYDDTNYIIKNPIIFQDIKYASVLNFIISLSKKYNSLLINKYLINFVKKNNLTHLLKKEHKNKYKNSSKQIKWKI